MRLDLSTKLSIPNLERTLSAENPYHVGERWSSRLSEEGLTVDLSRIEWVEPSALVMVVLLIEACVRHGFSVVLWPPRRRPFDVEADILSSAQRTGTPELLEKAKFIHAQVRRRQAAFESLVRWRMWPALQADHIVQARGKVTLEDRQDPVEHDTASAELPVKSSDELYTELTADLTYRQIFPLYWITDPKSKRDRSELARIGSHDMLNFLAHVLRLPDRGVSTPDARTMAHVFLFELAENVAAHAKVPFGLLAVWARPALNVSDEYFEKALSTSFRASELEFGRWAAAYPLVEVILGDSGEGIPRVLGNEFVRSPVNIHGALGMSTDDKKRLSKNKQIMFWSLDKWSSSILHGPERGTRGLYRVRRVVTKWEGALTIRTESDLVGFNSHRGARNPFFWETKKLAQVPGTIVHLRLPVRKALPESSVVGLPRPVGALRFTVLAFDADVDVTKAIDRTIRKCVDISRAHPVFSQPFVAIIDLGLRDLDRHQVESLLVRLIQVAHPTTIVVANLGAPGWESLLQIADSIDERLFSTDATNQNTVTHETSLIRNAVLVVHGSGNAKWLGHESWLCNILDKLTQVGELRREDILSMVPQTVMGDQALRDLSEQSQAVDSSRFEVFRSLLNLGDIVRELSGHMSLELQSAIRNGEPPVVYTRRIFVTPSQRFVNSYIRADELLVGNLRLRAIGLLALHIRLHLSGLGGSGSTISIVTDEGQARGLATDLREQLGEADIYPVPAYSKVGRLLASMSIKRTNRVIIFTDLISTGSMVKSLLDRVVQNNMAPALVACVIDARQTRDDCLTLSGTKVPVISLTRIDISPDQYALESLRWVRINPVTARPEPEPTELSYELQPELLDSMVVTSGAMYFRHIRRSDWRHFTIYLDAWKLLGRDELASRIIKSFVQVIDRWLEANSLDKVDAILYPQTFDEPPSAQSAAERIAQELSVRYGGTQIRAMSRKHGTTQWVFGDQVQDSWTQLSQPIETDNGKVRASENLVVLDWGCISGQTAHEMISLVSLLEARNALIVFFVSQLSSREELGLRAVRQVSGRRSGKVTQVTVEFITRCGTWAYSRNDCPYCEQIRRFAEEVDSLNPPQFLTNFVSEASKELEPKTLQEVRQLEEGEESLGEVTSMKGIQLSLEAPAAGLIRIARFRELLREAEGRTHERERVRNHILSLRNEVTSGTLRALPGKAELIRLAASEWTLFERPPLKSDDIRTELASIAVEIVQDESVPQKTRQNAIIVLRTASSSLFVQHLPQQFVKLLPYPTLERQLLYCAFTLLKAQDPEDVSRLPVAVASLRAAAGSIRELIGKEYDTYRLDVLETVGYMYDLALHLRERTGDQSSIPEAWQLLKLQFGDEYSSHHDMCRAISALFWPALDEAVEGAVELPEVPWGYILSLWKSAEGFLHERVLKYLPSLDRIFRGRYGRTILGIDKAELLGDRSQRGVLNHISTIRTSIERFALEPKHVMIPDVWVGFKYSRDVLWDLIFAYEGGNGERSALLRILDGCPFDMKGLPDLVENAAKTATHGSLDLDVQFKWAQSNEQITMFCHEEIIARSFHELFGNVARHLPTSEEVKGGPVPIQIDIRKDDGYVILTFKNARTSPDANRGRQLGLTICRENLAPYEASLNVLPTDPPWAFAVSLTFREGC